VIAVENLNVKKMMKNKNLSRSIADSAWNTFLRFLEYKSEWYGRIFVKIEMFYPSSKTCNDCKSVKADLQLSDREWTCEKCGVLHDRDTNAAENILEEGLKLVPWGSRDLKPAELM
jgi:putative transposase